MANDNTQKQEAAADRYWQSMVQRDRAARAEDGQTVKNSQTNSARVRTGHSQSRRSREGYVLR